MIKSSGAWCDICENVIAFGTVNCFGMPGLKNELHSCDNCKDNFEAGKTVLDWPDCKMKREIVKLAESSDINSTRGDS